MTLERADALAAVREPVARGRLPRAEAKVWLRTTLIVRRLLPDSLAVRRAELRGHAMWEQNAEERERAMTAMTAVVAGTARAHEVERLAQAHLVEDKVKETFFWQRWRVPSLDVQSRERLEQALSSGRGVILSSCHVGPYTLGISSVAALGSTVYSVTAPWTFEAPQPGYWGRRVARRRAEARSREERLIVSVGSFELLRALLEEREVVSIFFSVPGSRITRFLGKPVMLASGTARLAKLTGALVVPLRVRRVRHRLWLDVGETLDPHDYGDAEEIHVAVAAIHERWILELPATLEDPNREGSWEQSATEHGWTRRATEPERT